ncbi:hypothetical protein BX661DRAFT_196302 [Kickxella alabastrina]|uniref:uncharacterized protein n=1 Tax=Kickxella alabastrina TaxID=61397 RepID=UPI00221F682D|nr:uncharacterized protein BX661DRAFT_196302 [Kickxella alabastrina]KAI7833796.1 hypothetical protein BX661DRAFT_196302 [Kickxella alabastrina]
MRTADMHTSYLATVDALAGRSSFLGRAIVQALLTRRTQTSDNSIIRVLDITRNFTDPSIEFIQGDITNASDVTSALTHNNQTATTFVYTSSASVVYSGGALEYVDESLPYAETFGDFGPGDRQVTQGGLAAQRRNFPVLVQVGDNTAMFDFTMKPKLVIPTVVAAVILVVLKFLAAVKLVTHDVPFVFGMTFTPRYFNITKAKNMLGYRPVVPYSEGVPIAVKSCLERWAKEEAEAEQKQKQT